MDDSQDGDLGGAAPIATTYVVVRIVAIVVFVAGVAVVLVAIMVPKASLYPVGAVIAGAGLVGFYGSLWLTARSKPAAGHFGAERGPRQSNGLSPTSLATGNRVGGFMSARSVLQVAWFIFVGLVATTVGAIAIVNRAANSTNMVGGVVFALIGLGSFMASYYIYLKWQLNKRS